MISDSTHQRTILVMDDEEMVCTLASAMLTALGFSATSCANGEQAIERYKSASLSGAPYLAVIMDLTILGGMGGKDAAELILDFDPCARLIVSSGYSNDSVLADHTRYGFRGLLPKPYSLRDLLRVLADLLPEQYTQGKLPCLA